MKIGGQQPNQFKLHAMNKIQSKTVGEWVRGKVGVRLKVGVIVDG